MYSTERVALLCGTSVKKIPYYSKIRLLEPSFIHNETGYRYYSYKELEKLQYILILNLFYHFSTKAIIT
ncbi:MerR family transcriptional regulator [Priestia endophytica]|jgi:DNA-binding transcriptional MerR regulator|uniref:MerR family transcriptional regulator n=1 Tax=Priestia endophytica TaxID=135735 RepID=UPI000F546241